jgi:protein-tyrosine-phosphatase
VFDKLLSSLRVSSVRSEEGYYWYREIAAGTFFRTYYGGRLPFLRYYAGKILYYLGVYGNERNIDWLAVKRLIFVCKGNINRSPFAEYYCKKTVGDSASLGLDTNTGLPASDQAISNAMRRNISLTSHKTCKLSDFVAQDGDLFIVFESSQAETLRRIELQAKVQITLLGLWAKHVCPYIQDPICREDSYFQTCYSRIEKSIDGVRKQLENSGNSYISKLVE